MSTSTIRVAALSSQVVAEVLYSGMPYYEACQYYDGHVREKESESVIAGVVVMVAGRLGCLSNPRHGSLYTRDREVMFQAARAIAVELKGRDFDVTLTGVPEQVAS